MNVDGVRRYCLSFAGTSEGLQWGECLLFRVGEKIFVNITLADTPPRIWLKCTPERCSELLEIEGARRAPYLGKHNWVELERIDLLADEEMRALIKESYENVRSKLPRRIRDELEKEKQTPRRAQARLRMTKKQKAVRRS